ncbi:MAG: hemolysin D, partial [Rhodopirellula sp. JB053]
PIAVLENPELKIRLADLQGEERFASVQLANLKRRAQEDAAIVAQLETQEEMLHSIRSLRAKTQEEIDRLTIKAKQDGFVLPPPERPSNDPGDGRLPGWTGTPLQERNRGALLTADDMICEIGSPEAFEAVLIIDQGDRQLVRENQLVDLKLDSLRLETFHGSIEEISKNPMAAASTSMSSQTGGDLQTEIDPKTGQVRPRSVSYQARVPIDASDMILRPGYRGAA